MAADPSHLRYELPGPLFFSFFSFLRSLLSFNLFAFGDGGLRQGVERFCSRPRMELPGGWESWGGGVDAFATICTVCSGRAPLDHLGGHSAKGVVPGVMRVGASPLHSLRRGCIGIEFAELALVQPWVYSGWYALSVALCSQSGWAACTICGRWGFVGRMRRTLPAGRWALVGVVRLPILGLVRMHLLRVWLASSLHVHQVPASPAPFIAVDPSFSREK